jgi:hypothetical protein
VNRFVSIAVAVVVALHTVLGCCWHHAHAATVALPHQNAASAESAPAKKCCHHHHDEPQHADDEPAAEHSHHSCPDQCDDKCEAPALLRVQHDDVVSLPLIDWMAAPTEPVVVPAVVVARVDRSDGHLKPPPLRLHLLHQLLLI